MVVTQSFFYFWAISHYIISIYYFDFGPRGRVVGAHAYRMLVWRFAIRWHVCPIHGVQVHRSALGVDGTDLQLQVIWALGPSWGTPPGESDVHSDRSGLASTLNLATGAVAKASVSKLIIIHGLLMAAAWLVFMPVAVFAARFRADVHGYGIVHIGGGLEPFWVIYLGHLIAW